MIERRVLDDPAVAGAERIAAVANAGGHIALTGGSTPRAAYELVASMDVDWTRCTLWFGDERCVPPEDERSNYRMVRMALLDRISGGVPAVRRMVAERGPHEGAAAYDDGAATGSSETAFRSSTCCCSGLGPDGHCASLFPGDQALEERSRLAVGVEQSGLAPWVPRVTLTLPVLNAARDGALPRDRTRTRPLRLHAPSGRDPTERAGKPRGAHGRHPDRASGRRRCRAASR